MSNSDAYHDEQFRSRDASASESFFKLHKPFARRTDLRERMPAVVAGNLTIHALSHERRKGKRNAERR
jgi:hypothetical protein